MSRKRSAKITLVPKFLSRDEERLVIRSIKYCDAAPGPFTVAELGRVGKSGARLLLCQRKQNSIPLVVKIDLEEKIRKEHNALQQVRHYFRDATTPATKPALAARLGALVYWHQGGDTGGQIKESFELRDVIFDAKCSESRVRSLFFALGRKLESAQQAKVLRTFRFITEYRPYLRRDKSIAVLQCLLGSKRDASNFQYLGTEIVNPILYRSSDRFTKSTRGFFGPVHGDLHANNVIVDSTGSLHLIDFAWAHPHRHLLKDIILMECSLRFLLFPMYVDLEQQLNVDELLLDYDGADRLAEWTGDSPLRAMYRRLGAILAILRTGARNLTYADGESGFVEYLSAQFLILYGLLKYNDYNRFTATRALGMIARRLAEAG